MKHLNIGLYVRNSHLVDSALGKACHDLSGAQATVGLWMWRVGTQLSARFESIWVQGHAILQDDPWPTLPTSTVSFVIIPRWCIIHFWSLTINQRRCGTAVEKCDGILEGFEVMISWKAFFPNDSNGAKMKGCERRNRENYPRNTKNQWDRMGDKGDKCWFTQHKCFIFLVIVGKMYPTVVGWTLIPEKLGTSQIH